MPLLGDKKYILAHFQALMGFSIDDVLDEAVRAQIKGQQLFKFLLATSQKKKNSGNLMRWVLRVEDKPNEMVQGP